MKAVVLMVALALAGCAAPSHRVAATPNEPAPLLVADAPPAPPHADGPALASADPDTASLMKQANFAVAMKEVEKRQLVFPKSSEHVSLKGNFTQGGLAFGHTLPGAKIRLDGEDIMVGEDGRFVIGFGRDAAPSSLLAVTLPDGKIERIALKIADRDFPVQRIDGLDESKVSKFSAQDLAKIAEDKKLKDAARATTQTVEDWAHGFALPIEGTITGVFGSQRILNGKPKSPHGGLDVAAPKGTPIHAPADGVVTLAQPDMYFEGGLVLIDHGFWLESALMHMSKIEVKAGEHVTKGQEIGLVGATGRATGPHMHWGVKWMGVPVDPQLLVSAKEGGPQAASAGN